MRAITSCALACVLLLGACSAVRPQALSESEQATVEAVRQIAVSKLNTDEKGKWLPIFVVIQGEDPDPGVLAALQELKLPIKPASDSIYDEEWMTSTDKTTDAPGVLVKVDRISVVSSSIVEVEAAHILARHFSGGATYVVEKIGACWKVTSMKDPWIS